MSIIRKTNHPRVFVSLILFMLIVFGVVTPNHAQAAMLTVNTLIDENDGSCSDGDCSLRDAIQVAAAGDTINFSVTGTILLNLGRLNIAKNLSIIGPGPESLTVDGNQNGQIFVVYATYDVNISGMTITNGINMYGYGGGVHNLGTCTITNAIFNTNSSVNPALGGGLYNEGTATLTNVTFSGNSGGGGMYNSGHSTLTNVTFNGNYGHGLANNGISELTNVTFSDNIGGYGVGMHNGTSSISTLTNVTFSDNSASNYGGGIYNDQNALTYLTNVTFNGNSALLGGGMYTRSKTTLTNVTFNDNSASGSGGGMLIVIGNFNTLSLTNVTFSGNTATNYGGGLSNSLGTSILTNVTFSNNSAGNGGGVYVWSGSIVKLKNSLLSGGIAPNGSDCGGTLTSYGYNLIQDTSGCTITGDQTGNVYGEDPQLGPLGHYGGYTLTHALLPGSSAIDAADFTDYNGNPVTLDQRGVTRPQGPANDIGAFEFVNQMPFWLPVVIK